MDRAKKASEQNLPSYIPYQVCPICDNVFYWLKEPFGPDGCHCKHDPADGPQPGDPVILTGSPESHNGDYIGSRAVINGPDIFMPDKVHICLAAMIPYRGASGLVDISGGPFTSVDPAILKPAGIEAVSFWKWNSYGPGADHGEYYVLELPCWEMDVDEMNASAKRAWAEFGGEK